MPCYEPVPTPQELRLMESARNLKLYGMSVPDNVLIAILLNHCCEMGNLLEQNSLLNGLSDDCYYWFTNHKERDEAKKREEALKLKEKEKDLIKNREKLLGELEELNNQINEIKAL